LYIFFGFEAGNPGKGNFHAAANRKGGNKPLNGKRTKNRQRGKNYKFEV
jgi:hypothetical protein